MKLLQYQVSRPITVQECDNTLTICKFCHRFVDPCAFYCNCIVITCAKKINDVRSSFHQYYPISVEDPIPNRRCALPKTGERVCFQRKAS